MQSYQISPNITVSCQSSLARAISIQRKNPAIIPSVAFRPDENEYNVPDECGTTTWYEYETPDGDVLCTTLETLYDQPTHYPVDPDFNGMTAAYTVWVLAQQDKSAARRYAIQHGENTGDQELTELRRIRRLTAIRRQATQVPVPAKRGFRKAA